MTELLSENAFTPKGVGSDTARLMKPSAITRLLYRPELGALSGAILVYVVFYAVAGHSDSATRCWLWR